MGIILFLVDTSASMNQKSYLGTSYLDVAKVAIDTFTKVRCVLHHALRVTLCRCSAVLPKHCRCCTADDDLYACSSVQYRQRDPASRYDRYMLVSFDDPPNAIKVRIRKCTELWPGFLCIADSALTTSVVGRDKFSINNYNMIPHKLAHLSIYISIYLYMFV